MNRILVTGASGFVGRPLVTALAQAGYFVRAATRQSGNFGAGVDNAIVPDLAGKVNWPELLHGIDAVIHLAGIAHTGRGVPEKDYDRLNRDMTAALAEAARVAGVSRLVFLSSIRAQYGPTAQRAVVESDPPRPSDAYGRSKLAAEAAVRASGVPYTILRPVLVYGPGAKGNLEALLRIATSPLPLPFSAFAARRSLLGIDNLIGAIMHCLETPQTIGETYIVADPAPLKLPQVIAAIRRAQGRRPGLFFLPPRLFEVACAAAGRSDLWQRIGCSLEASPAKLMASGWRPSSGPDQGFSAMVQTRSARKSGTASLNTR